MWFYNTTCLWLCMFNGVIWGVMYLFSKYWTCRIFIRTNEKRRQFKLDGGSVFSGQSLHFYSQTVLVQQIAVSERLHFGVRFSCGMNADLWQMSRYCLSLSGAHCCCDRVSGNQAFCDNSLDFLAQMFLPLG